MNPAGPNAVSARPDRRAPGLAGFGSLWHLALRFLGSLSPAGPRPEDTSWAEERLSERERALFVRMSGADRRHAIGVAREALRLAERDGLSEDELPAGFLPAALLHDVGKVESRLGTFGRVLATLLAIALGRRRLQGWQGPVGSQFARYLAHDRLGSELLAAAGSDAMTVSWARDHHLPDERWRVEAQLAGYLKAADGD